MYMFVVFDSLRCSKKEEKTDNSVEVASNKQRVVARKNILAKTERGGGRHVEIEFYTNASVYKLYTLMR